MTGSNHAQAAKAFILIFIVMGAIVFGFWQTAKNTIQLDTVQLTLPAKKTAAPAVSSPFADGALIKVSVGSAAVTAEIAQSDAKKALGLGKRVSLAQGSGMLFVFDKPSPYRFWNKDMNFPIDIVWILDNAVADTYEHLPDYATSKDFIVTPASPVNFVLEVPDGFVKKNKIQKGDRVTYEPEKN